MKKIWLFLLSVSYISAQHHYILTHRFDGAGFFSSFHTVLGVLDFMETNPDCSGLSIDFAENGFYYDKQQGPNWWNYYFEPIDMLNKSSKKCKKFSHYQKVVFSVSTEFGMPRERAYELIQRYVHLKPHIASKINDFYASHFQDSFVIGIHYRGTDKCIEAEIVPYRDVIDRVNIFLAEKNIEHYKIFVATDDLYFLAYIQAYFPGLVVFIDAARSDERTAVHLSDKISNYKKGEDAIIDCVLLSKCDVLFKMSSNLSNCSIKFNPDIPIIELNKSNGE